MRDEPEQVGTLSLSFVLVKIQNVHYFHYFQTWTSLTLKMNVHTNYQMFIDL